MPEECRNIYKRFRKKAGLTQEAAAEQLRISVESLRAYETGQRVPPNRVVSMMVDAYNSQLLGIWHLRDSDDMVRSIVPAVQDCSVLEASAKLYNRMNDFYINNRCRQLMRITEDNVVDDIEQPDYDRILDELQEISEFIMAVKCARQGD